MTAGIGFDSHLNALLSHLHRGGLWAYYWTKHAPGQSETLWFPTGIFPAIPDWPAVYFGVHPTMLKRDQTQRARVSDISAINCLYADFDADQFNGKDGAQTHIQQLNPAPSVIIDSGGGYHGYWLLDTPHIIGDGTDRLTMGQLQARWVGFVGGDPQAKDLARVLRLPGSLNHKYSPARPVVICSLNLDQLYSLDSLQEVLPAQQSLPGRLIRMPTHTQPNTGAIGEYFLKKYLNQAVIGNRNDKGKELALQLRDNGLSENEATDFMLRYARSVPQASGNLYIERDAINTLRSIYSRPPREPAHLPGSINRPTRPPGPDERRERPIDIPVRAEEQPENNPPTAENGMQRLIEYQKASKPTDDVLRDRWLQQCPDTAYGLGEWRRYFSGVWLPIPEEAVAAEIVAVLEETKGDGIKPSRSILASVMELARLKVFMPSDRWDADPDLVVCKNGVLDIRTMSLATHSPGNYVTSRLGFNYDPKAEARTWLYLLNSTVPEAALFLQEYAGYCLTTDTRYETALWLTGPRGCGKSTLEEGFLAMLGDRATNLGLADIERSRFSLWNLRGKTLAIASEQPAAYIHSSHLINAIISGEVITIERKFKDPVDFRPCIKIIWAMNELPRIAEAGNGLFRRVKVLKFPPLDDGKRDPRIKDQIKTEGPGILNWALEGLRRLRERGHFDIPRCVGDATDHFQATNDIPAAFIAECCLTGPGYKTKSSLLYGQYTRWCDANRHKPKSSTAIAEDWDRLGMEKKKEELGMFWYGIGLRSVDF